MPTNIVFKHKNKEQENVKYSNSLKIQLADPEKDLADAFDDPNSVVFILYEPGEPAELRIASEFKHKIFYADPEILQKTKEVLIAKGFIKKQNTAKNVEVYKRNK